MKVREFVVDFPRSLSQSSPRAEEEINTFFSDFPKACSLAAAVAVPFNESPHPSREPTDKQNTPRTAIPISTVAASNGVQKGKINFIRPLRPLGSGSLGLSLAFSDTGMGQELSLNLGVSSHSCEVPPT